MPDPKLTELLRRVAIGVCALGGTTAVAQFDPASLGREDEGPKVTLSLIAEKGEITPGKAFWLGVRYEIIDGWHVYWHGLNDTGYAPNFTVTVPDGFEIGEARWPAPHRYELPGSILDHVYEEELTILVPVRAPADLELGAEISLGVKSDWLVCEELCIPEDGEASVTMRVGRIDPSPDVARAFERARARLPVPAASDRARDIGLRITPLSDTEVEFVIPGAERLVFYPGPSCSTIENLIETGAVQGDRMRLEAGDRGEISGVLEARLTGGETALFEIGTKDPPRDDVGG